MINICVPVLKRYDLLRGMLMSLRDSTVEPSAVYVFDNGCDAVKVAEATYGFDFPIIVESPTEAKGLAETWNHFIINVPDERFIVNDDLVFAPMSLERMVASKAPFVSCSFGFSCFLLRDECVRRVGHFDETISPGYAYFEDRDYYARMQEAGIQDEVVLCDVLHLHSQTPMAYTPQETDAHHKKFVLAQENFLRKWGKLPADLTRQYA